MTSRKPRAFEEKVNDFLRRHQSGVGYNTFIQKYPYMGGEDIETVVRTCKEIEKVANDLANHGIQISEQGEIHTKEQSLTLLDEAMRKTILEQYPYLEPKRLERLISNAMFYVLHG